MAHATLQEFLAYIPSSAANPVWLSLNQSVPYIVTCSSANATAGAVYSNNGAQFTVLATIAAQTTLDLGGGGVNGNLVGSPGASGTFTKVSGTGDATITFSSVASATWSAQLQPNQTYEWYANGYFANPFTADLVTLYGTNLGASAIVYQIRTIRT
jgi:hypothetical protein